ncbi:ComEC/Rec2 family competence protein [Breoghania sp.]|uniref:ComEC/Rec2 family competence protein n=1 Tax=Breoghania sp. TaxID=2065378 RepID=UPI002AA79A7B|nr:ComEC/Rec2 family competence protein [Breoghania sp.]
MAQEIKRRVGSVRPAIPFPLDFLGIRTTPGTRLRSRVHRLYLSLLDAMRRDLERGAGFPWLIVCYACGIWLYFELPREPQLWATAPLALALIAESARRRRRGRAAFVMLALAALATGLATADFRTWSVATPRLTGEGTHTVTGWVEEVEPRATGYRLSVHPATISGVEASGLPVRIRVTGRAQPEPTAGSAVRFRARLSPPQGPVLPGGYAFDRAAFYEQVGAYGFIFGRVENDAGLSREIPFSLRMTAALSSFRARIGERIRETYGGDSGAIAAALIVGERGAVSKEAQEDLRIAGLAHVLAISGMHMALVAGVVFFVIRAGLALSPALALRHPIRSWAAGVALAAATLYLVLSGASIATQRAYVMAAVIFLSMIAGRPAVTMRSVALAAAIVLALTPEALLQPGFQMSFSAVIALIAAYKALFEYRRRQRRDGRSAEWRAHSALARILRIALFWGAGLVMTSLIAGLATGPAALTHFYRSSPLGLIANMAAMPLVSLAIMPLAVVSLVAMPYGLDPLPLYPMQAAIDAMLSIAAKIADWTPGAGVIGAIGDAPAILFTAGLLWLALWSSRWRLLGIAPMCLAVAAGTFYDRPDMFVSEDGHTLAIRGRDGYLAVDIGPGGKFAAGIWLRADGDPAELKARAVDDRVRRCDAEACIFTVSASPEDGERAGDAKRTFHTVPMPHKALTPAKSGDVDAGVAKSGEPVARGRPVGPNAIRNDGDAPEAGTTAYRVSHRVAPDPRLFLISRVMRAEAFEEDCIRADIVVTPLTAPADCSNHAVVIDRAFLTRHGAAAIYWPEQGYEISAQQRETTGPEAPLSEPARREAAEAISVELAAPGHDPTEPVIAELEVTVPETGEPETLEAKTAQVETVKRQYAKSETGGPETAASKTVAAKREGAPRSDPQAPRLSTLQRPPAGAIRSPPNEPDAPPPTARLNRAALRIVTVRSGQPRPWQARPEP